jgi:hypothetical protein
MALKCSSGTWVRKILMRSKENGVPECKPKEDMSKANASGEPT